MPRQDYIALESVRRSFGSVTAVDDVSLGIGQGEFFSLLGPSGCGKTTLLRLLAGLDVPTSGKILIDGIDMSTVPANRRPTNMVFQSYAIFPHLSVAQNIAYGLKNRPLAREDIARRVIEALRLIKLEGYGERRPHQLSGGQRQRVALARALVCEPKVLLLDEPLGALDKKLREEMQVELRDLQRKVGVTFVFVTHDQEEALALSDRIAVMSRGVVKQVDTAEGLYEAPNSRAVAAFIGTMNFLEGTVSGKEGAMTRVSAGPLGQFLSSSSVAATGDPVAIAIRPEKIVLHGTEPSGANVLRGRITATTYMGDRSHHFVAVDGVAAPFVVSSQNTLRCRTAAAGGETAWLSWLPEASIVLGD